MGTIHHGFAIAVAYDDRAEAAFQEVKNFAEILNREDPMFFMNGHGWEDLLVGPVDGMANSYSTYMVVPDGSKEGWSTSEMGDRLREFFIITMGQYADVADGSFGELRTRFNHGDEELVGENSW